MLIAVHASSHLLFTLPLLKTIWPVPFTHEKALCWGSPWLFKGSHTWASWPQVTSPCPRAITNSLCLSSPSPHCFLNLVYSEIFLILPNSWSSSPQANSRCILFLSSHIERPSARWWTFTHLSIFMLLSVSGVVKILYLFYFHVPMTG